MAGGRKIPLTLAGIVRGTCFILLAAFLLYFVTPRETGFDGPLQLAGRMLQGHTYFDEQTSFWEMFERDGRYYLVYAPMVSLLLVPYVLLGGAALGMPVANTLFILASTLLLWRLFRSLSSLSAWADWAAVAYLLGTPLLFSVATGNVWLIIHSQGNLFLIAALLMLRRRQYVWFGFCYAMAICCRNALLFTTPLLIPALWGWGDFTHAPRRRWIRLVRRATQFVLGTIVPIGTTLLLHWSMTGNPLLSTYQITYQQWGAVSDLYSVQHFRDNLHFFWLESPKLVSPFRWPFLRFEPGGQAFWIVSPFFLLLLGLRQNTRLFRAMLLGAIGGFIPYLFFKWNGYAQFGSRYVSDLFPFLLPLAFSTLSRWPRRPLVFIAVGTLIFVSIVINAYGAYLSYTHQTGF
jgi:hypothetical protein